MSHKKEVYGRDWVTDSGVLYCSRECAIEDGCDDKEIRQIAQDEYDQQLYGALCTVCEGEYAGFIKLGN